MTILLLFAVLFKIVSLVTKTQTMSIDNEPTLKVFYSLGILSDFAAFLCLLTAFSISLNYSK